MFLWRISNYSTLDGAGGLYASGRWHTRGRPVFYSSRNPATALLEILVHLEVGSEDVPDSFQVLKLSTPDDVPIQRLDPTQLPDFWYQDQSLTRRAGDAWLAERRTLLLEVPSILVPESLNVIVNPLHPQASRLRLVRSYRHPFDPRLLRSS